MESNFSIEKLTPFVEGIIERDQKLALSIIEKAGLIPPSISPVGRSLKPVSPHFQKGGISDVPINEN